MEGFIQVWMQKR